MSVLAFSLDEAQAALAGRYELTGVAGKGGQGFVFRGRTLVGIRNAAPGQEVAIKLHADSGQDLRAEREIEVMTHLRHPCMAGLHESGLITLPSRTAPVRFVSWEYIEGPPMNELLATGPLPPRVVAVIGRDVSSAIMAIWQRKIVHRDVNPKNIIVRPALDRAVLIDLGLARHLDETTLTAVGFACGTPGYMAPEQAMGEHALTSACDVFALGLTMFCGLLGAHPFGGDQRRIMTETTSAVSMMPKQPRELTSLIDSMISPRIAFRPMARTIAETCERLSAIL